MSSTNGDWGKPLAIDLYCGLGGWTEGLIATGYEVIGFDNERHTYGNYFYPAHLVLQDVTTLHGKQFRDVALIVASPPCQAYSYRAMPWKRAKALPPPDNTLFETCFRLQREAIAAAGRFIPLVVENVRGAQKWVGPAKWHYGSFYLWGDIPALMPIVSKGGYKSHGMNWCDRTRKGQDFTRVAGKQAQKRDDGTKVPGLANGCFPPGGLAQGAIKNGGDWFGAGANCSLQRRASSSSNARKAASAVIAKIPFALACWIAECHRPGSRYA